MNYKQKLIVANASITDPVFSGKLVLIVTDDETGSTGIIVNAKEIGDIAYGEFRVKDDEEPPTPDMIMKTLGKRPQHTTPMYYGGPCEFPGLYFIHGYEEFFDATFEDAENAEDEPEFDLGIPKSFNISGEDNYSNFYGEENNDFASPLETKVIMDGLYFGSPAVFCKVLKSTRKDRIKKFKFLSGHAVWSEGQLQDEIDLGAWTVIDDNDVDPSEIFFDKEAMNDLIEEYTKKPSESKKPLINWLPSIKGFDTKRN